MGIYIYYIYLFIHKQLMKKCLFFNNFLDNWGDGVRDIYMKVWGGWILMWWVGVGMRRIYNLIFYI